MSTAPAELLRVEVAYCPRPGVADVVALRLSVGSTLADALKASGLLERHALPLESARAGLWSRVCEPQTLLRDLDRVELYRGLQVDPKEARRQRYKRHKAR